MSSVTLSEQQRQAVTTRDVSVALSAGAGCGKTFVLTERFLAHLDPRDAAALDLSELVAITFTDRAAREMRDRIRLKCYDRLREASGETAHHWQKLLRSLEAARVSTIHAFCASLLRSHAVEARLDPQFGVLEEAQSATLLAEVIDDELREGLAGEDGLTLQLVRLFKLDKLQRLARELINARQQGDFSAWLGRSADEQLDAWEGFHRECVLPAVRETVLKSRDVRNTLAAIRDVELINPTMRQRQAILLALPDELPAARNLADYLDAVKEAAKVQGGGGAKAWPSQEQYETFKGAAEKLRKEADKHKKCLTFDREACRPAAEAGLALLRWCDRVIGRFDRRKQELESLDFNDLLLRAHRLLMAPENEKLRQRLARGIGVLLVDEFQDTDPLQVELIRALCGERLVGGKLFFVGDYKQSIYRFRGADPQVFLQLQDEIRPTGRLSLTTNYRSQPAILNFVNEAFSEALGENYEPLRENRPQVTPEPAVEFLWTMTDEAPTSKGATERVRRAEADRIARRLTELLDTEEPLVWDADAPQPAARRPKPGDVAILFRALSDVEYYEQALRNHEIDYYLVGGHAFYAQQEIFDLLNLLRAVDRPADEVSLAGVLRSPFFSLTDETLYWLSRRGEGLTGGLFGRKRPAEIEPAQIERVHSAARTLSELRAKKDRVPIATLIEEAFARTGYDAAVLGEFLGERKLANLRKLTEQARGFDRSGVFGLSDFIVQLSEFVANQPREPLAATQPESMDVVRLMTIHQAKGLEFPIVLVPDLDRAGNLRGDGVAFSSALGPLVQLKDEHENNIPGGYDLFSNVQQLEDDRETLRLLYVACTRAADYLLLSSSIFEDRGPASLWTRLIDERFGMDGRRASGLRDRIRVTGKVSAKRGSGGSSHRRADIARLCEQALERSEQGNVEVPASVAPIPPHPARRQFSFSRISGEMEYTDRAAAPEDAAQRDGSAIDARGLGTLVHAVLEKIDLSRPGHAAELVERLANVHLPGDGLDTSGDSPAAALRMIDSFVHSHRAKQLVAARQLHRELEFLLGWPPGQCESDSPYMHGYIDGLYQDADGTWRIVDFKTNRVSAAGVPNAAKHYELQMYVYSLAASRVLGEWPREAVLCFLHPGVEHRFAWDEPARAELIKEVSRRIAKAVSPGR
ncbi:MAG: UvrD-helicase domain-containing protein [Pirellulales bacterium]